MGGGDPRATGATHAAPRRWWQPRRRRQLQLRGALPRGRARAAAWSKCPPWQCPSSAPAPPQGTPDSSGWLVPPCAARGMRPPTSCAMLTRTSRGLRTVRAGYAYQPPACCTYQRRRAACLEAAPRTVRAANCGTTGECFWHRNELDTARYTFVCALDHDRNADTLRLLSMLLRTMARTWLGLG